MRVTGTLHERCNNQATTRFCTTSERSNSENQIADSFIPSLAVNKGDGVRESAISVLRHDPFDVPLANFPKEFDPAYRQ